MEGEHHHADDLYDIHRRRGNGKTHRTASAPRPSAGEILGAARYYGEENRLAPRSMPPKSPHRLTNGHVR